MSRNNPMLKHGLRGGINHRCCVAQPPFCTSSKMYQKSGMNGRTSGGEGQRRGLCEPLKCSRGPSVLRGPTSENHWYNVYANLFYKPEAMLISLPYPAGQACVSCRYMQKALLTQRSRLKRSISKNMLSTAQKLRSARQENRRLSSRVSGLKDQLSKMQEDNASKPEEVLEAEISALDPKQQECVRQCFSAAKKKALRATSTLRLGFWSASSRR